ncbi:hypothetical protein ACV8T3_20715, partial [Citrobacter portucalensis]
AQRIRQRGGTLPDAACRLIRPAGAGLNVFCRPDKRSASGNAAVHCRMRRAALSGLQGPG